MTAALEERFWANVDKSGECWEWTGRRSAGYGVLSVGHRNVRATRLAVELTGRAVAPEQIVMHTCDNPPCVRPDHLRVATQADNVRDMFAKRRNRSIGKSYRTECPSGHPYDEANTIIRGTGRRVCRTCELTRESRRPSWHDRYPNGYRNRLAPSTDTPEAHHG
jgi:hypothetical protein